MKISSKEIWFVTGSQHLYGDETLAVVASNAKAITGALDASPHIPIHIEWKPTVTTPSEITNICIEASASRNCIGIITWMHTFSPAKMWIQGLKILNKPLCHLHTQFNAEIPWANIDMNFMNLNQSAHGDREFAHILSRIRKNRKIVVGHWKNEKVHQQIGAWSRVALGCDEMRHLKVARLGDNMREVAVTEGDKVEAQFKLGVSVNGYDTSNVTDRIAGISGSAIGEILDIYASEYKLSDTLKKGGEQHHALVEAAKIELALRSFLEEGGFSALTDTFENLGRFRQLPGIAIQRLMEDGYGFGAEGDWKTAALLRVAKVMSIGLQGGSSFMEDYTYHFAPSHSYVLGSHMLEICPSIASGKPSCEIHPLGIGGKNDPVRLVFDGAPGPALNASLIDVGNRLRLIVNEVEAEEITEELPHLPVARVLWQARPKLEVSATAWMLAGGAHHTVYTQALTTSYFEDFAKIFDIEILVIDESTRLRDFENQMRTNEVYFHLFKN